MKERHRRNRGKQEGRLQNRKLGHPKNMVWLSRVRVTAPQIDPVVLLGSSGGFQFMKRRASCNGLQTAAQLPKGWLRST
jgi:hypothetical protein